MAMRSAGPDDGVIGRGYEAVKARQIMGNPGPKECFGGDVRGIRGPLPLGLAYEPFLPVYCLGWNSCCNDEGGLFQVDTSR